MLLLTLFLPQTTPSPSQQEAGGAPVSKGQVQHRSTWQHEYVLSMKEFKTPEPRHLFGVQTQTGPIPTFSMLSSSCNAPAELELPHVLA